MTTRWKFRSGAARRCTKKGVLILTGMLYEHPPLAAAESEMTQEFVTCMCEMVIPAVYTAPG
jgi:hypothetical protein